MRWGLCGVLIILAANTAAQPRESARGFIAGTVLDPERAPIANV